MISVRILMRERAMRGFTLLEVLVVLVIVSLVSVVLMQGMSLVLGVRANFGDQMDNIDQTVLTRNMIRQPLQGVVADFTDGEHVFTGSETMISGLTIQPLLRRPGRPIPFAVKLEYDEQDDMNRLLYQEDRDEPLTLAEWKGERARFTFIGDEKGWTDVWPPDLPPPIATGTVQIGDLRPPQLPELIYLNTASTEELDYGVAIAARRNRVPRDPVF